VRHGTIADVRVRAAAGAQLRLRAQADRRAIEGHRKRGFGDAIAQIQRGTRDEAAVRVLQRRDFLIGRALRRCRADRDGTDDGGTDTRVDRENLFHD
jgi:hypothetical protein